MLRHTLAGSMTRPLILVAVLVMVAVAPGLLAQEPASAPLPQNATALEGTPRVRVETTEAGATRHVLSAGEAETSRLSIRIDDGRFYWTSRDNRPLSVAASEGVTYLMSKEPGRYIRFTRLNDRWTYVEHVDRPGVSTTYWGELRVVLGK